MKKLLALVLVLVCALSMAACDDGEALATETMEGFMNALVAFDGDAMAKYLDDKDAVPEAIKNLDIDVLMATMPEEQQVYKDNYAEIIDATVAKMSSVMNYEIKEVAADEDGFVYTIAVNEIGDTNIIDTTFSEENMNNIINALVEEEKLTETTTEEELMDMIFDEMVVMIKEMELEASSVDKQFFVYEKDGKWVVNAEKSNVKN